MNSGPIDEMREKARHQLFAKLSRMATFAELLARIHDAISGIGRPQGRENFLLPIQVLADHLEELGHHEAADAVRLVVHDGVQVWQAMEVKFQERSLFDETSTAMVKFLIKGIAKEEFLDNIDKTEY